MMIMMQIQGSLQCKYISKLYNVNTVYVYVYLHLLYEYIFIYVGMAASQNLILLGTNDSVRFLGMAMELYLSVGPGTSVASGPRKTWRSPSVSASAHPVHANRKANGKVFSDISATFLGETWEWMNMGIYIIYH